MLLSLLEDVMKLFFGGGEHVFPVAEHLGGLVVNPSHLQMFGR